jgi:sarcosine oxidase subunit gamma
MKGCSLDLDPAAFGPGRCAQTALARAHMLLHQVSDVPCYHVYAHRSFADYVFAWLEDAAAEYLRPAGG